MNFMKIYGKVSKNLNFFKQINLFVNEEFYVISKICFLTSINMSFFKKKLGFTIYIGSLSVTLIC